MDSRIPIDGGEIIPDSEVHAPGSLYDVQQRIGTMLVESGLTIREGMNLVLNVAIGIAASNAASPQGAQRWILHLSRNLERLAPSAAQAHFELHHGGLRG